MKYTSYLKSSILSLLTVCFFVFSSCDDSDDEETPEVQDFSGQYIITGATFQTAQDLGAGPVTDITNEFNLAFTNIECATAGQTTLIELTNDADSFTSGDVLLTCAASTQDQGTWNLSNPTILTLVIALGDNPPAPLPITNLTASPTTGAVQNITGTLDLTASASLLPLETVFLGLSAIDLVLERQ